MQEAFFGRRVLAGTFVLAIFGWGLGFYGPPIYLQAVIRRTGWDVSMVSSAVTLHFVVGAFVVANLPRLYRRAGVPLTTGAGAVLLAMGTYGWAIASTPIQLFTAAALGGCGWVAMGAAAVNALISPWFVATRPAALGMAYNGASVGGIVFSPLWVLLIERFGFAHAALGVGAVMVAVMVALSRWVFSRTPEQMHQAPDAQAAERSAGHSSILSSAHSAGSAISDTAVPAMARAWTDRRFRTLCAGMALGLFAQIGLIAHLFSIIVPLLGERAAGLAMALATCCAIVGRTVAGRAMPAGADRRKVACIAYLLQAAGSVALLLTGSHPALLWLGLMLFGSGIGNATSLPPLIAQTEFRKQDAQRVIPLMVAVSQGAYAFAPAAFGLLRSLDISPQGPASRALFVVAAAIQLAAIACLLMGTAGRGRAAVPGRGALSNGPSSDA